MVNATNCLPGAGEFSRAYSRLHGYVALVICVVGSATNSINIAVLSRREMTSTTNSILTGLAFADLLVMLEYIPYALHMNIKISAEVNKNTYAWACFVYFHSIFSQIFHTISIWLAVTLAVWRYVAIAIPQKNRSWCSKRNTTLAIVSAYMICPFLCLPIYFAMNIRASVPQNNSEFAEEMDFSPNRTVYVLDMSENVQLVTAIMWIYSVILKLVPSIALSILSMCLITKLTTTERKRQKLLKRSSVGPNEVEKQCLAEDICVRRSSRTDRTTRMLLAVLGLFLSTEVPQGLLGLASALFPDFFKDCYGNFGDLMDVLALLTSSVNFVLYCSMSRQFRCTFARLARKMLSTPDEPTKFTNKLEPTTQHPNNYEPSREFRSYKRIPVRRPSSVVDDSDDEITECLDLIERLEAPKDGDRSAIAPRARPAAGGGGKHLLMVSDPADAGDVENWRFEEDMTSNYKIININYDIAINLHQILNVNI